jgi:tetratricopeptide (TPR) repeat protein
MSASARLTELKKRYNENPRRFFAPLANEFRKSGDLHMAIGICERHLAEQPSNMNGHVVYGQALFEVGRVDEAHATFSTAITLDPENLIALRHLGDIARLAGDPAGAREWFRRILDADPRNEEILGFVAEMDAAGDSESADRPTQDLQFLSVDDEPEGAPSVLEASLEDTRATTGEFAVTALELPDFGEVPSSLESSIESTLASSPDDVVAGDAGAQDVAEFSMPVDRYSVDDTPVIGFERTSLEVAQPIAFDDSPFFTAPEQVEPAPLFESSAFESPPLAPEAVPVAVPEVVAESFAERKSASFEEFLDDQFEDPFDDPSEDQGSPFVTATMAELYLQQGHTKRALEVYQQLALQRPDDEALKIRIRALMPTPVIPTRTQEFAVPTRTQEFAVPTRTSVSATVPIAIPTAIPTAVPNAGPTAREHFAAFATFAAVAAVAPSAAFSTGPALAAVAVPGGGAERTIDAFFGHVAPAQADEEAARVFETYIQPLGES